MGFFQDKQERYIIIGNVCEDDKRVGYKVYADNQRKVLGLVTKKEAYKAKEAGLVVVGLSSKSGKVSEVHNSYFNINKLDIVNGKGHPIKSFGNYVLAGFSGFAEERKYRLLNSRGYERIANQEEYEALVDEGKVIGAMRSTRNKDIITRYEDCDYREEGFEETVI